MKLIIDIPEEVVTAIQNGEDYRYDIHTAIAQGIPYEPKGDLISREALKKALTEAHINMTLTFDIATFNCVMNTIDNAPTVTPLLNLDNITEEDIKKFKIIWQRANSKGLLAIIEDKSQGEFTRRELESWLYAIATNNTQNELGSSCEEIISRLDGFERYVSDMRKGVISCE